VFFSLPTWVVALLLVALVGAVAVQAFAATLLGTHLGTRLGDRWSAGSERLAGIALIALAAVLLVVRLTR